MEFADKLGLNTGSWRPRYTAREWLALACSHLECDPEILRGRGRTPEAVRLRELIGLVGIERYGVKVIELAGELGKSRDGVNSWCRRGASSRAKDPEFAADADALDQAASEDR